MIKFKEYITEVIHGPTDDNEFSQKNFKPHKNEKYPKHHFSLSKHYTPWLNKRYEKYSYVIGDITTCSSTVNSHLNDPNYINKQYEKDKEFAHTLHGLVNSKIKRLDPLTTSYEAPHDFHVYTGIKFDPSEGKDHKEPFKAHIKQFTSATLHPGVARKFSSNTPRFNHILKIHIPKGSKHGAYIHDHSVQTKAGNDNEYEFLLKRNLKLKIHHEPEIKEGEFKIWHATIED